MTHLPPVSSRKPILSCPDSRMPFRWQFHPKPRLSWAAASRERLYCPRLRFRYLTAQRPTKVQFFLFHYPWAPNRPFCRVTLPTRQQWSEASQLELGVIDRQWGKLFDEHGQATSRFKQILHALGTFIIDEFLPQNSLVMTPAKFAAFYSDHPVRGGTPPLQGMFRRRTYDVDKHIADLYHDLGCEYHLVPIEPRARPTVPGLTPAGFSQWIIVNIRAYPDEGGT